MDEWNNRPVRQPKNPQPANTNTKATIAAVCGIVSLFGILSPIVGFIFGIAAIIFSVLGLKIDPLNKQAKTGRILGIIGLILSVGIYVFSLLVNFGIIDLTSGG